MIMKNFFVYNHYSPFYIKNPLRLLRLFDEIFRKQTNQIIDQVINQVISLQSLGLPAALRHELPHPADRLRYYSQTNKGDQRLNIAFEVFGEYPVNI